MKLFLQSFLFVFATSFLLAQGTHAYMASAPTGTGYKVIGACKAGKVYTQGRIALPSDVSLSFKWLETTINFQIRKIAESYKDGQNRFAAISKESFAVQDATLGELFSGLYVAEEQFKNSRLFGAGSSACDMSNGKEYLRGLGVASRINDNFRNGINEFSVGFDNIADLSVHFNEIDADEIDPRAVFPSGETMSVKDAGKVLWSMRTITNTFPSVNLSQAFSGGNKGVAYQAARTAKRLRSMAIEAILSDVMSDYVPAIEVNEEIEGLYSFSSGRGELPAAKDGKLSLMSYLGLLIETRFAGDGYRAGEAGVHGKNKAGLLREYAAVKALRLVVEQKKMRRAQQMSFLAALQSTEASLQDSLELNLELRKVLRRER